MRSEINPVLFPSIFFVVVAAVATKRPHFGQLKDYSFLCLQLFFYICKLYVTCLFQLLKLFLFTSPTYLFFSYV